MQQSQAYCYALYQQWRMLDFRGIMHVNMDSHINIALEDVFVVPDVLPIIPEFETLERDEAPRITNLRHGSRHKRKAHQEKKLEERREDFLSVLAAPQNHHLVLLGDPGAGKTTLLRYLLLQLIDRVQGKPSTLQAITPSRAFLPLYIPLAAYASAYYYTPSHCTLDDFLPSLLKDYSLEQYTDLLQIMIDREQVFFLFD
jgi:predicted NACHT family NTPase